MPKEIPALKLDSNTVIKIATVKTEKDEATGKVVRRQTISTLPRYMYVSKRFSLLERSVRNCLVIPSVGWHRIYGLADKWRGRDKDGVEILTAKELESMFKSSWTAIPISPKPLLDQMRQVSDWSPTSLFPSAKIAAARGINTELSSLLLENAEAMRIVINGKRYDSPCMFCEHIMKRVAGDCPIAGQRFGKLQVCRPKLNFADILGASGDSDGGSKLETGSDDSPELASSDENLPDTP